MSSTAAKHQTGAELLIKSLEAQGVEYIFGIPGGKVDQVFDTLFDSKIKTIVCRHEQNATFIAAGIGRMTGRAGVVLVTSGPGCANIVSGLATANSEGDPVVAIGGEDRLNCGLSKEMHLAVIYSYVFPHDSIIKAMTNSIREYHLWYLSCTLYRRH